MEHQHFSHRIIGCAMRVHSTLGPGFLESVYQKALSYELQKHDIRIQFHHPIKVYYDNVMVGDFFADLLAEDKLIIELKAVLTLTTAHEVQLVNYLSATGVESGLLINFGGESLEFKRKFRKYRAQK